MAITSAICSSFKQELLQGKHSFESSGGHTFKIALFDSDANLGASTTDYSTSEEITNTSGTAYTAGGATLTNSGVSLSSTTAFTDFADVTFTSASFTAISHIFPVFFPLSSSSFDPPLCFCLPSPYFLDLLNSPSPVVSPFRPYLSPALVRLLSVRLDHYHSSPIYFFLTAVLLGFR